MRSEYVELPLTLAQVERQERFVVGASLPRPPREWCEARDVSRDQPGAAEIYAYEVACGLWPEKRE
jgi:hypothetical protein